MATAASGERKIDIGQVVSRAAQTLMRQAGPYLGLGIALGGLPGFVTGYVSLFGIDKNDPMSLFTSPLYWGALLLSWLGGSVLQATIVRSSILDLSGRPADIGGSLRTALSLILPLIGLTILTSIILAIGFILLIVPGIVFYIVLSVAVPVLVEERPGVIGSMERSRRLTEGSRWQIFGVLAILVLFYIAVTMVLGAVTGAIGSGNLVVQLAVDSASGIATALASAAILASLYVELRTVREGATTESLAAIFE